MKRAGRFEGERGSFSLEQLLILAGAVLLAAGLVPLLCQTATETTSTYNDSEADEPLPGR